MTLNSLPDVITCYVPVVWVWSARRGTVDYPLSAPVCVSAHHSHLPSHCLRACAGRRPRPPGRHPRLLRGLEGEQMPSACREYNLLGFLKLERKRLLSFNFVPTRLVSDLFLNVCPTCAKKSYRSMYSNRTGTSIS